MERWWEQSRRGVRALGLARRNLLSPPMGLDNFSLAYPQLALWSAFSRRPSTALRAGFRGCPLVKNRRREGPLLLDCRL
jgi:hypothetical protein